MATKKKRSAKPKKAAKRKAAPTKNKKQMRSMVGRKAAMKPRTTVQGVEMPKGPLNPKIDPVTGMPIGLEPETRPAEIPPGVSGLKKRR